MSFLARLEPRAPVTNAKIWTGNPQLREAEALAAIGERSTSAGKNPNGWVPEQKISIEQAVSAYIRVPFRRE